MPAPKTLQALLDEAGVTIGLGSEPCSQAGTVAQAPPGGASSSRDLLGRYRISRKLGAGGMGQVLEVHDEDLDRQVAAKIILGQPGPQALARFVHEAKITGQLQHPGIVPVHELGLTPDGTLYFTMKQVLGQDLSQLLGKEREQLEQSATAAQLDAQLTGFLKVCDALAFAHSKGVIHRDLKPANIMVGRFGEVLVMDWGLAKVLGQQEAQTDAEHGVDHPLDRTELTLQGAVMGTPNYMPPEQAAGKIDQLDKRSDIYSLGAILYEILTLALPHIGESLAELLDQVTQGRLVPPTERAPWRKIPWELEAVVLRAMAREQADRYPTVEAMHADIKAYLEGRVLTAAQYNPLQLLAKWVGRHQALCRGVAAVLVVMLGLLGWMRWQRYQRIQHHLASARAATRAERYEQAIREFDRVLAIEPGHTPAGTGLTQVYLASVERQLAGRQVARQLAARWRARDKAIRMGQPERPEEPAAQRDREATLNAYLAAVASLDRALARFPNSTKLKALRLETETALGWTALLGRDYSLARQAFSQLQHVGLTRSQVEKLTSRVNQDRTRRLGLWKMRLQKILDDFRQGLSRDGRGRSAARYEDHLIEAAGYRHPEIAALLAKELRRFVDRRTRHEGPGKLVWLPTERALAIFTCQVLGRLTLRESVAALGAWMQVVTDDRLAAEAGIALCNTRRPRAHALLTAAMYRLGLNSNAWQQIKPFFGRIPDPVRADSAVRTALAHNERGLVHLMKDDLDRAIHFFTEAIKLDPGYTLAYHNRGIARRAKGDLAGAFDDFTTVIKINPRKASAYNMRAVIHEANGDLEQAINDYTMAIKNAPRNADAYNNRGNARQEKGDLDGALEDFTQAIKIDPRSRAAYINRGATRFDKSDFQGALDDCNKAIEMDPRAPKAYGNRGNARQAMGDPDGAINDYSRAIKLDPRYTPAYIGRGNVRQARGDFDGAITDFTQAIKINPKHAHAHYGRGNTRRAMGNLDGALEDFNAAIKIDPRFAKAYYNRGSLRQARGDRNGAILDYTMAIKLDARFAEAYHNRGVARQANGDLDGAINDFNRAIQIQPKYAATYNNRGNAHQDKRQYDRAISDYTRAIEKEPRYAEAYFNRGNAHRATRQYDRAIRDYTRAIRYDPKFASAYNNRAYAHQAKGDLDRAIKDFSMVIKLAPRSVPAYVTRGIVREAKGDLHGAIADYDLALKIHAREWRAWANRGVALARLGQRSKALDSLRRALKLAPANARPQLRSIIRRVAGK